MNSVAITISPREEYLRAGDRTSDLKSCTLPTELWPGKLVTKENEEIAQHDDFFFSFQISHKKARFTFVMPQFRLTLKWVERAPEIELRVTQMGFF